MGHAAERLAATLTSFGGGILLAAVALELVPDADERAGTWLTAAGLPAGAVVYVAADAWLSRNEDAEAVRRSGHAAMAGRPMQMTAQQSDAARGEAIAAGLCVDGIPESIALGLTIAEGEIGLALLVGVVLGNVVEAYGAAQPIAAGRGRGFGWGSSRRSESQSRSRHWPARPSLRTRALSPSASPRRSRPAPSSPSSRSRSSRTPSPRSAGGRRRGDAGLRGRLRPLSLRRNAGARPESLAP